MQGHSRRLSRISNKTGYFALWDPGSVFEDRKIIFWLDCGTLLGVIRNHDFIPWEKDIDLGCWKFQNDYEIKQKLKNNFKKLGYEVFMTDYWLNIHFQEYEASSRCLRHNFSPGPTTIRGPAEMSLWATL